MACQCNNCSGTEKCSACSGTGEVEPREFRSFRRTRLHRFDSSEPQICGVWRYRTLAFAKVPAKPMPRGETLAKDDSVPANPECADEKTWPCSAEDWRRCDKCQKLVCERHDYLVPRWPPENAAFEPADMICKECIAALWDRGDISQGARAQYIY